MIRPRVLLLSLLLVLGTTWLSAAFAQTSYGSARGPISPWMDLFSGNPVRWTTTTPTSSRRCSFREPSFNRAMTSRKTPQAFRFWGSGWRAARRKYKSVRREPEASTWTCPITTQ